MAHESIQPSNDDDYVAGKSLDIRIQFTDKHSEEPEPITEERHVEFFVKNSAQTRDTEALVHKSSEETGADGEPEITVDGPELDDGECIVHILAGDTADAVDPNPEEGERESEVRMWIRADLYEGEHRVVSPLYGEWPMISA